MNLSSFQAVKHLVTCGNLISDPITEIPSVKVGDFVSLGEVDGIVHSIYFNLDATPPQGHITYEILAEVILNKYGKEMGSSN